MSDPADRLIIALDVPNLIEAYKALDILADSAKWFKIGSQLFTAEGPAVVQAIKERDRKVFLDLKFHDIPATVQRSCHSAAALGVDMLNVHSLGGANVMEAAVRGVEEGAVEGGVFKPTLIGVTILTSMGPEDLKGIGVSHTPVEMVLRLAELAKNAGLDGVVASPEEITMIKMKFGEGFVVVTPGIRPNWASKDDQRRVKTPAEAIREGADYLVVGRPVLKASDPAGAARKTLDEIASAMA